MSMRFVDLQTLLPRTQEASRAQEAAQRQPQVQAAAAAEQQKQASETAARQVRKVEHPEHRRVSHATDEEKRRQRQGEGQGGGRRGSARGQAPSRPASGRVAGGGGPRESSPKPTGVAVPGLGQNVDVHA